MVDYLTPNRLEAVRLAGASGSPEKLAAALLDLGTGAVAITLGADGVLLACADGERERIPAELVPSIVDSSGRR